ncbi:MAG: MBL fold metallo-hydrolase [Ferroplasma sp.]
MNNVSEIQVPIEIRALKTANVYNVAGESNYIIDTGMSENSYRLIKNNFNLSSIEFVLITHLHIDHIGGALYLEKENNIPICISQKDFDIIKYAVDYFSEYQNAYKGLLVSNGVSEALFNSVAAENPMNYFIKYYDALKLNTTNDLKIKGAEIIDVPGHTPGSIALYLPDIGAMFTGDHVLKNITPNISIYSGGEDSLGMYLKSLDKIKNYKVNMAYPGHRDNFSDLRGRVEEIIKHHEKRISMILDNLDKAKTAYDVASSIGWSRGRKMETMNLIEQNFAIMETIAHLIYMENNGLVYKKLVSGKYYYQKL